MRMMMEATVNESVLMGPIASKTNNDLGEVQKIMEILDFYMLSSTAS